MDTCNTHIIYKLFKELANQMLKLIEHTHTEMLTITKMKSKPFQVPGLDTCNGRRACNLCIYEEVHR